MELNYDEFKIKKIFINILLKNGKKSISEKIYNKILLEIKKNTKQKPYFILIKCIKNLLPKLKTISIPNKKKGKQKKDRYFLMFLIEEKQIKESIKWLFINSNLKSISNEIIQTSKLKSKTFNYKKEYYKEIKKLKFNIKFN